jgi:hypothetical protein
VSDEETAQVNEREITEIEAWELRYAQLKEENHVLRDRITQLREQVLVNQKEILRRDKEQHGIEKQELMTRLEVDGNAMLIEREGSYFIAFEDVQEKA